MTGKVKVAVLGGGVSGIWTALSLRRQCPEIEISLYERQSCLLGDFSRQSGVLWSDFSRFAIEQIYPRGFQMVRHWQTRMADGAGDLHPFAPLKQFSAAADLSKWLRKQVEGSGINVLLERKALEASRGSDGRFSVWFNQGNPWEGDALVLAAGGQFQVAHSMLQSFGHEVSRAVPSMLSLKVQGGELKRMPPVVLKSAKVTLSISSSLPVVSTGGVSLEYPLAGGEAIAGISAQVPRELAEGEYQGALEIEPEFAEAGNLSASRWVDQCSRDWGSNQVWEKAPEGVPIPYWRMLLAGSGVPEEARWARLAPRQIQSLGGRLNRLRLKFSGYRLWKDETGWAGGANLDAFVPTTLESRKVPSLYVVGDMLDIDGMPGGHNLRCALTSAEVCAHALARRWS